MHTSTHTHNGLTHKHTHAHTQAHTHSHAHNHTETTRTSKLAWSPRDAISSVGQSYFKGTASHPDTMSPATKPISTVTPTPANSVR
jgi:hypothetical protein